MSVPRSEDRVTLWYTSSEAALWRERNEKEQSPAADHHPGIRLSDRTAPDYHGGLLQ